MKVLSLFGYFKLPDDFDGSLKDAMHLLINYEEEKSPIEEKKLDPGELWSRFYENIKKDKKLLMNMSIHEHDKKSNKMVRMFD